MSTRTNLEFYTLYKDPKTNKKKEVLDARLYHHSDGYPSFMYHKIKNFLAKIIEDFKKANVPYWWDGERVSAMFVLNSVGEYGEYSREPKTYKIKGVARQRMIGLGVPRFQPCIELHSDIEYLYRIYLEGEDVNEGAPKFKIKVYVPVYDKDYNIKKFRPLTKAKLAKELKK
jgi:hypothetical protein